MSHCYVQRLELSMIQFVQSSLKILQTLTPRALNWVYFPFGAIFATTCDFVSVIFFLISRLAEDAARANGTPCHGISTAYMLEFIKM